MQMSFTVILAIVVVLILLKYARKFASKIFIFLMVSALVVGAMYYKSWGPFETNVADIATLEDKYCNLDPDICDCIVQPAKADMATRFSKVELDSLGEMRIKSAYILKKSLASTKEQAIVCLGLKGATDKYAVFLKDFVPVENQYIDIATDKIKVLSGKLRSEVETFRENKDEIDGRY